MIVTPATSEGGWGGKYTVANMLAEKQLWLTKEIPSRQVESVVLGVAAGSRVTSFDINHYGTPRAGGLRRGGRRGRAPSARRSSRGTTSGRAGGAASRATTPPQRSRFKVSVSQPEVVMATAPASPSSAPRVPPLRRNNDSHLFSIYIRYVPSIHCWLRLIVCLKRERVHFSAQPSPARGRRRSRRSSLRSPPKCLPLDRTSQG